MRKSIRGSVLCVWILALSLTVPYAHSASPVYGSLEYTNDEVLFLGDILKIDAGWCWPSKKPTQSLAKKRLEIYKSGRWQSVGKVVYLNSPDCPSKTPYLQQFQWEVDELGIMNPDQISGKLRLRNAAVKPTLYSKVSVFESELAYEAKLKADEEADKKAQAENVARYMDVFNCFIKGGEWNSLGNYCVLPKG
jgi:hypothetical protein